MFTRKNAEFLAVIADKGVPRAPIRKGQQTIEAIKVDSVTWKAYHKRGGETKWSAPVEHAILWTEASRSQYTIPQSATAGKDPEDKDRQGIAVSGVASRLSARMAHLGAMWESNKVFVLFPKDPSENPPLFLLALLNSERYAKLAALMNHTVSLQIRDLKSMPLLPFTAQEKTDLAAQASAAIECIRDGLNAAAPQSQIDKIVESAWDRCRRESLDGPDA
jgi:hypothetical protein